MGSATIGRFLETLAERVPLAKADRSDPVGLQLGDPDAALQRVAICHEVSDAVLEALESEPAELLLSYHPLWDQPLGSLLAGRTPQGRALRLASAGVALAVVHTGFAVAQGGAADALADAFELEALEGFAPLAAAESVRIVTFVPAAAADAVLAAAAAAGAARAGNYSHCSFRSAGEGSFFAGAGANPSVGRRGELNREPEQRLEFVAPRAREAQVIAALYAAHPYEEPVYDVLDRRGEAGLIGRVGRCAPGTRLETLLEQAREVLGAPAARALGAPQRVLGRVAVVPGSGAGFASAARAAGADALITADWTARAARAARDGELAVVDPGHAASERPGLERLFTCVAALAGASVRLLRFDPDPWWS